ncbi:unnamed protein product [Moneuplotes crassus]|uniref:Uncharacterized protein n=1 Tax=Euplotes crassus TaxID=5936 RepID=A0AAD2D1M1_EUPCR|nr:unnamed protein product [Moneuplotes crassus]
MEKHSSARLEADILKEEDSVSLPCLRALEQFSELSNNSFLENLNLSDGENDRIQLRDSESGDKIYRCIIGTKPKVLPRLNPKASYNLGIWKEEGDIHYDLEETLDSFSYLNIQEANISHEPQYPSPTSRLVIFRIV